MSAIRSSGCHTCRKRRIKCDDGKPTCQRCKKSGYECAGYEKPLHFRVAVSSADKIAKIQAIIKQVQLNDARDQGKNIPNQVPESMSLVAFKPTLCYAYVFNNFVWRSFGHHWLVPAATGKISPLALQATSALSQSNFGSSHHQLQVKVSGSVEYGQAVRALIPQLSVPAAAGNEALIVPILLLIIHDSSLANLRGTVSHMRGLVQLLMVCGPERFQCQPLRATFESCRAMLITGGIMSKRRLFLEDVRWRTIPWGLDPNSKSQQNHLADILVTVPGMLEDDGLLKKWEDATVMAGLIVKIEQQLTNLFNWRWRWQKRNQSFVWQAPPIATSSIISKPLHESLHFANFELSTEITLYNAVHIWLTGLLWRLAPADASARIISSAAVAATRLHEMNMSEQPYQSPSIPLLLPGMSTTLRQPAIEICRIFEYQCQHAQHSRDSALWYLFPIGLAYSVLEHEEQYRGWLRAMLDSSPVTSGYLAGQNETGFGFYLSANGLQERLMKVEEV